MLGLRCPRCGGPFSFSYHTHKDGSPSSINISCSCWSEKTQDLTKLPACARFFGKNHTT
ncbi:MAG: hypothetical protein LBR39_03610 [Coriobacteriales bacterium]|nr:hypothetical protein [Coriobacteriales bacterium]